MPHMIPEYLERNPVRAVCGRCGLPEALPEAVQRAIYLDRTA